LIVTSREVLNLYGEHVYPVPPLGLPEVSQLGQTAAILSQYESVHLFVERARAANPSFDITEDNAATIAEICLRLDGLPLAIELAAARSRLMTPDTIRGQLGQRLKVLTGGARNRPARQQTLRGAIDWSYDLLDPAEQRLFARLSIFAGGWTPEAAEAVCNSDLDIDVYAGLEALLDKSLIRQTTDLSGRLRFAMLETIREYALDRLRASGEADAIASKHTAYFTALAQKATEVQIGGSGLLELLDQIEEDQNNYRAVLEWCLEPSESGMRDMDSATTIVQSLFRNWISRRHGQEGRAWVEKALALTPEEERQSANYGTLLMTGAALLAITGGDIELAGQRATESVAIWRQLDNPSSLAMALLGVGSSAAMQDRFDAAEQALLESLELSQASGMIPLVPAALMRLSDLEMARGDYDASDAYCQQVMAIENHAHYVGANALNNLGEAARCRGDYRVAATYYQEALDQAHSIGASSDEPRLLHNLGYIALHDGDVVRGESLMQQSLLAFQESNSLRGMAEGLNGLGAVALARGDAQTSVTLMAAAQVIFERVSAYVWPADRNEVESRWQEAQRILDPAVFAQAETRGRTLLLDNAIDLALNLHASS
jgi:predicted ATPase